MAQVTFYEKPGCINNTKQKALLLAAGHQLDVHNLLTTPWTPETLRPFLAARPVKEWFNSTPGFLTKSVIAKAESFIP
jgi:nitrogenase-associated protein